MDEFRGFPKIPRFSRDIVITEKIDGTNSSVVIIDLGRITDGLAERRPTAPHWKNVDEGFFIAACSRNRFITPDNDNFGFADWVWRNASQLLYLQHGTHFGEWWGSGIQRGYGLNKGDRRFSLFNTARWTSTEEGVCVEAPCCYVVPTLYRGEFDSAAVTHTLSVLKDSGSAAAPGFMDPEGVIIYHTAGNMMFKKTIKNDEVPKALAGDEFQPNGARV